MGAGHGIGRRRVADDVHVRGVVACAPRNGVLFIAPKSRTLLIDILDLADIRVSAGRANAVAVGRARLALPTKWSFSSGSDNEQRVALASMPSACETC